MKPASQEQKDQFAAKFATSVKPARLSHEKLQLFVGLSAEEFDLEFAKLINAWEPPVLLDETAVIELSKLPEPKFPEWSRGRILTGVVEPKTLDLSKLSTSAWFHPNQTGNQTHPTGHEILSALVSAYDPKNDKAGTTYAVLPTDIVNGHYGLCTLTWLAENWKVLPKSFREWAKNKLLYGWAGVVRDGGGYLSVPCLSCDVGTPYVVWCSLDCQWKGREPALREQVSTQG